MQTCSHLPIGPLVLWVPETMSCGVKRPERGAEYSPAYGAGSRMHGSWEIAVLVALHTVGIAEPRIMASDPARLRLEFEPINRLSLYC
jgi:hypothetical protein